MGNAARVRLSATQKFIQRFPQCCFCAGKRPSATRDHMPPKALFDNSHRPDELVVPACIECNSGTSTADLIVSIMSRWSAENTVQELDDHHRLATRLRKQAPEIIAEWNEGGLMMRIKGRRHLRDKGVSVPDGASTIAIGALTVRQLNLFAHKATLALYFEYLGEALLETGAYFATWRTKEDYAVPGLPSDLLRLLPQYATLSQGRWNTRETFEYRLALNREDGLLGFFARLRWGVFVSGFAVRNAAMLPPGNTEWLAGGDLLNLLTTPRFCDRH